MLNPVSLFQTILEDAAYESNTFKVKIVFLINNAYFERKPIAYLIKKMIERSADGFELEDDVRAFVMGRVPEFIERAQSTDYLYKRAVKFFKNDPNKEAILAIFEQSLLSEAFQKDLKATIDAFTQAKEFHHNFIEAEQRMRGILTLFHLASHLSLYQR